VGVVNESLDDMELERLLTQLLRVVSPAPAGEPPASPRATGSPAISMPPADGSPRVPGHGGTGHGGTGPRGPGPRGTAQAATDGAHPEPNGHGTGADPAAASGSATSASGGSSPAGEQADIPTVSPSEARALIELVSARGIAQGELAGLLGLEKSTVSRLAAGLERKGWIRRGRDEENQRYVRLYLTPEGRTVAARVWAAWQSRQARILGALSAEERVGLSAGLRGLVRGLAAEGLLGEPPGSD
jgi:DNA-binding MarR family transcriptional regulator